ncbi:hypothetical protein ACVGVM_08660 [Pseudonocardia bannensis]|uniref:DUF3558 domain-containing protein n=1 Tax=Pseudonocardia bannensis TaxID=630973 RepID=A0A848DLR7_9PSEU|nr:hypothetical protein [Pseudonocardia bannensis]NMH93483.1 hypothetical protein [Pseudonocardia bannensis]
MPHSHRLAHRLCALALLGAVAGCQSPTPEPAATEPGVARSAASEPTGLLDVPGQPADDGAGAAPSNLDACSLLTLPVAEETVDRRTTLMWVDNALGPQRCLYGQTGTDPDSEYSVRLDLLAHIEGSLAFARETATQPNVVVADEAGLGTGAYSAVNVTFAEVGCTADGVDHLVTVGAPATPPGVIEAHAAFALEKARRLAGRYCS